VNFLLSEFEAEVLTSVVEGHLARAGLKERMRALNEWEIARRLGQTEASYAQFDTHPDRERLRSVLTRLEHHGFIAVWERGIKYDSFVPTQEGSSAAQPVESTAGGGHLLDAGSPSLSVRQQARGDLLPIVVDRLDEIIRLLRSLESRLGGR
jgi:hypothetical protein